MGSRVRFFINEVAIDYLAGQLSEFIEYIEKATGRKFDDEWFIEAANNEQNSLSR